MISMWLAGSDDWFVALRIYDDELMLVHIVGISFTEDGRGWPLSDPFYSEVITK